MTEPPRPGTPDEPVIGGSAPAADHSFPSPRYGETAAAIGEPRIGDGWSAPDYDDPEGGQVFDDYYEPGYEDSYDDYYDEEPARQPLFYIFIGLAVILGALLVFMLFQLLSGGGDDAPPVDPDFNIAIDSPLDDERVDAGSEVEVRVRANSTEPILQLQLVLQGGVVDEEMFETAPADGIYSATLAFEVDDPGNYEIVARAVSESGATRDSEAVRVIAVERIDEPPSRITGEVISTVNAREGPGDEFTALETLDPGQVITVVGRSRDSQWLLLDDDTWIRRAAVQLSDSLDLVEVAQPTATAGPTATATPEPEPSPSPPPSTDAPDLGPTNATLDDGGSTLRVTIANLSSNEYEGPLVVRVTGLNAAIEQVFSVSLGPNSTQSVEFELAASQQSAATVQVSVDPDGQIDEASEDNNAAAFSLAAPISAPEIIIANAAINADTIRVTITNVGGDMQASDVVVTVALGGEVNTGSRTGLQLASAESQSFTITRPAGSGTADITVRVNGQQLASGTIAIADPNAGGIGPTTTP